MSVFGDFAWDGGTEGAPSPLPVKYTIEVDPKRGVVSKRFPPLAPLFQLVQTSLHCTALTLCTDEWFFFLFFVLPQVSGKIRGQFSIVAGTADGVL